LVVWFFFFFFFLTIVPIYAHKLFTLKYDMINHYMNVLFSSQKNWTRKLKYSYVQHYKTKRRRLFLT